MINSHPHNANLNTYNAAVTAAAEAGLQAKKLDDVCFAMCFDTIEATDARADAVALFKAIQALRDAAEAAYEAARLARSNADARAKTLAKVEGRLA